MAIILSCSLLAVVLFGVLYTAPTAQAAKVLIAAIQMDSHTGEVTGASERLQDYGHDLYVLVSNKYPKTERYVSRGFKILTYKVPEDEVCMASGEFQDIISDIVLSEKNDFDVIAGYFAKHSYADCEYMMEDRELLDKIAAMKFDLMVIDGFVVCPCYTILSAYFNVPFVAVSAIIHPLYTRVHGLPNFVPTILDDFGDTLTLGQKFKNTLSTAMLMNLAFAFPDGHRRRLLDKFNVSGSWDDLMGKAELFISSRNYVMEWPSPAMPHNVAVPGLSPLKTAPLNEDFSKLMASNPLHGVIVMTFGSMFDKLPDHTVEHFLAAFARIKQTVVWRLTLKPHQKYELPPNVHVFPWLPQASLLAHPNTRLFITHCGNGGQHEATYNGVPMLGVPLFAEQPHNAFRMEQHGIGRRLQFLTLTEDDVYENIMELLSNPSYTEKSQKMSRILKDRPMSGQEEAAYWINHVIQFGGAHLRPATLDMSVWQFWMIDMLLVVVLVLLGISLTIYVAVKYVRNIALKNNSKTKVQ